MKMKKSFVDCFMLVGTALSLRGDQKTGTDRAFLQDVYPTTVNVSLTLNQMSIFNLRDMEVQLTFLLHQKWVDPRLGANQRTRKLAVQGQIWRPRITITEGENHINENEITQFWRGTEPDGDILLSEKIILRTFCTTDMKKFPFDIQNCFIKLGTYRFPMDEVELKWEPNPIENLIGELKEFKLASINTYTEIDTRPSGNFTVLKAHIQLKRYTEHYIMCIFYPCLLAVVITGVNFWLSLKLIKMRYYLCGISFCILVYFYHYSICLISVPYLKASDIYVIICKMFVFVALLEIFFIDLITRKRKFSCHSERIFCKQTEIEHASKGVLLLDRIISIAYPILFISISFFYCVNYV